MAQPEILRSPSGPFPALLLVSLLLLPLLAACAGIESLRPGPGGPPPGVVMLYPQAPDKVFTAAVQSLPMVGLTLLEAAPDKSYLLAERGVNAMSYGENVGVYFKPHGAGTQVTVASRRKMATNVAAKDFAMPLHLQLGAFLGTMPK